MKQTKTIDMKKTILTLLTIMCSLVINAQDTLGVDSMIRNNVVIETDGTLTMVGVDIGLPIMGRGLLNANVTIPQKISGDYNIIHYMAVGYSSSDNKQVRNINNVHYSVLIDVWVFTFVKVIIG